MTDAFEEGDEQTVSFDEYIKGVEEQELEVDLVLGGDDGNECTYNKGYMKRQAIFSCLTCTPDGNAGVCTACSLSCHDGHEILELWTKRNFRCDCGNSKFGEFFCKLSPNKDIENVSNSYNHNFKGSYCTCDRPYPDPDAEEQVEMLQCCVCEDWFHEEHIGLGSSDEIPRDEEGEPVYEDFICPACSSTCYFLTFYGETIWASARLCDGSLNDVERNSVGEEPSENLGSKMDEIADESSEKLGSKVDKGKACDNSEDLSGGAVSLHGEGPGNCSRSDTACVIGVDLLEAQPILEKIRPMFLSKNWREKLCSCGKCSAFCRQKNIGFLLDIEDSIAAYERMGKRKRDENLEQQEGMVSTFLNKLGHIEKIEILSGIADLKNEIQSFMESYDSSKPVTAADVQQVFDNLAKKRRRQL